MTHKLKDHQAHQPRDHEPEHHHEHADHDHGGSWSRIRHAASELFGGHSHDAADQVDQALEADARGRRALWISLLVLAVTALLQAIVVALTGSVALLGDTLHNVADALTAVPLLVAFWLARRPANDRFTYGYGRAEDLAGLFVVAMIALSSILAGWEAIRRLLHPQDVTHVWAVAAAGVIGFLGNEVVAQYRIRVGRQIGSAALVADGLHARTDGFTSLAVLVGALGVAAGFPLADPIVGLVITVAILVLLRSAVRDVFRRLMDGVDPALVHGAEHALASVPGVLGVRRVRMRWMGHSLHADAVLDVDPAVDLAQAHRIAHDAEEHLKRAIPRVSEAAVHAYAHPGGDLAGTGNELAT